MKKIIQISAAVIMVIVAGGWVLVSYARTRPGAVANNGVTDDMSGIPDSVVKKMQAKWGDKGQPPKKEDGVKLTEEERKQMREEFEKELTPEEKNQMKQAQEQRRRSSAVTKAALSPEELARYRDKMRSRGGGGGYRRNRGGR